MDYTKLGYEPVKYTEHDTVEPQENWENISHWNLGIRAKLLSREIEEATNLILLHTIPSHHEEVKKAIDIIKTLK